MIWLQAYVAFPYKFKGRMVADASIIIYGLSSSMIIYILRNASEINKKRVIAMIIGAWFFINVIGFVKLPWVHPYDQPAHISKNEYK